MLNLYITRIDYRRIREMRVLVVFLAACVPIGAQPAAQSLLLSKTTARIEALAASLRGVMGVAAIDLTTGETLHVNENYVFAQASSIKIPILLQVLRASAAGRLRLDDKVVLEPGQSVGGSGHLKLMLRSGPVTVRITDLLGAMIETSDNTATNVLIGMIGMDAVNGTLDEFGLRGTRLRRVMLDSVAAARGDENVSTPAEMARLMQILYRNRTEGTASLEIMKRVEADFRAAIPAEIPVASKPGELTGVRCETGVVLHPKRPFALSVMSAFLDDGENPVPEAARIVFAYFDKLGRSNAYGNRIQ